MTKRAFENWIANCRAHLDMIEKCGDQHPPVMKNKTMETMLKTSNDLLNIGSATASYMAMAKKS